jgi:hypothetical protein
LGVPDQMRDLQSFCEKHEFMSGPSVLRALRNSYLHPNENQYRISDRTAFVHNVADAWRLGLWYADLSLLWLLGYEGEYTNRVSAKWIGETEHVPWTASCPGPMAD